MGVEHPGFLPAVRHLKTTRWSLVRRVVAKRQEEGAAGAEADDFCRAYWFPLYAVLTSRGMNTEEAREQVQIFMGRLFGDGLLEKADAGRGRLRAFLITSLENQVRDHRSKDGAAKRGGGSEHVPLEWWSEAEARLRHLQASGDPGGEGTERRAWALSLVETALASLETRYREREREALFEALLPTLDGPLDGNYREAGAALRMSEAAFAQAVRRFRRQMRREIEIAAARAFRLEPGPDLDAELDWVFQRRRT